MKRGDFVSSIHDKEPGRIYFVLEVSDMVTVIHLPVTRRGEIKHTYPAHIFRPVTRKDMKNFAKHFPKAGV
jgi:hypothetical protein